MKTSQQGYSQILLLLIASFIIVEIGIISARIPIKGIPLLPSLTDQIKNNSEQQNSPKPSKSPPTNDSLISISQLSVKSIQSDADLNSLNKDVDSTNLSALDNLLQQLDNQPLGF